MKSITVQSALHKDRNGLSAVAGHTIALLLLVLMPAGQTLMARQNGTIKGRIEMQVLPPAPNRQLPQHYGGISQPQSSSRGAMEQSPEVTNVVVYLEGSGLDRAQRDSRSAVLDQRDATFIPHVVPIVKGSTVRIVNRDKTYHNVFSLSPIKKFNIGRRPTGEEVPVTFDKTGIIQVFCDIHSHMSAFILVLNNSMFVQPGADGTFTLDDVPPGKYTIQAWHERFSAAPQSVTVTPGESVSVDFVLQ
jgi:plastocyanin